MKPAKGRISCYECDGNDCVSSNLAICNNAVKCYKMTVRDADGRKRGARGCIVNREHVPFYCKTRAFLKSASNRVGGEYYAECCAGELCNAGNFTLIADDKPNVSLTDYVGLITSVAKHELRMRYVVQGISMLFFLALFLNFLWSFASSRGKKRRSKSQSSMTGNSATDRSSLSDATGIYVISSGASSCSLHYENEVGPRRSPPSPSNSQEMERPVSSNSDSTGMTQRTLARQISLRECLTHNAAGSFGYRQVWRGVWHGENVAVKICGAHSQPLWARETEVYAILLRKGHDHVLGYIGSDTVQLADRLRYWTVVQHHPRGSLRNYLNQLAQPLDHEEMLKMCLSLANGLLYLHTEITGTKGKPSLAHCNLTSASVVVKDNGECAIAELGYALSQDKLDEAEPDNRLGCKRYMSPERLNETINTSRLESFFRADVYSLGLLFWEVCRRCADVALDYAPPYSEWLDDEVEPRLEDMRRLVVDEQRRPTCPEAWQNDQILQNMELMMNECWYERPEARLTSFRVQKNIRRLAQRTLNVELME